MTDPAARPPLPVLPTILVLAAAAVMVALGIWQLQRADEKAALIAQAHQAQTLSSLAEYPREPAQLDAVLYRRTEVLCERVIGREQRAGTAADGRKGWEHRALCRLDGGQTATIALGFAAMPDPPAWDGGAVQGIIAPGGRIVAAPPLAGLAPLAPPDPDDLPNNHLAYAGQWFFFALTALAIYWLALRRRRDAATA